MSLIALAMAQVGHYEQPPKSNRGPEVDVYTGGNSVPWCALFVCWLFRAIGKALPNDFAPSPGKMSPLCSVTHMERVFNEHDWLVREPAPGDVVFYSDRGLSDAGPGRHVGLVVGVGPDSFQTVEGNWGDRVAHRTVKRTDRKIVGFGRVP